MTIDERARHELFLAAEQALGRQQTETLMELLPPVGWADVATKHDLASLEERMVLRFEAVDQRFQMVGERLSSMDAQLGTRFQVVDQKFGTVEQKFDTQTTLLLGELDHRFNAQTRTLFLSLAGLMISLTTLLLAVR